MFSWQPVGLLNAKTQFKRPRMERRVSCNGGKLLLHHHVVCVISSRDQMRFASLHVLPPRSQPEREPLPIANVSITLLIPLWLTQFGKSREMICQIIRERQVVPTRTTGSPGVVQLGDSWIRQFAL